MEPYPEGDFQPKETFKPQWLWPEEASTKFSVFYIYWLLAHCIYYQIFVISRVSFERKP